MKKTGIVLILFFMIILLSTGSFANEYKTYINADEIYFEINSPEKRIRSNEIILEIYFNSKDNKVKRELFFRVTDLISSEREVIPAGSLSVNYLNKKSSFNNQNSKVLINKEEGQIYFSLELDPVISYKPPGEYRGNLAIGDGIYNIPISLKINPFAELLVNKNNINFNLIKPADNISNKEELEINVATNLEDWEVKFEFPQGMVHEDGVCKFPLENLLYSEAANFSKSANIKNNNLETVRFFSFRDFEKNKNVNNNLNKKQGNYNLKLNIWADIRDNWNCALAGEYNGEIIVTFINNN